MDFFDKNVTANKISSGRSVAGCDLPFLHCRQASLTGDVLSVNTKANGCWFRENESIRGKLSGDSLITSSGKVIECQRSETQWKQKIRKI